MKSWKSELLSSTNLILFFTLILFTTETAFMNAYCRTLGINPSIIDKNFYTIIYDGFLRVLSLQLFIVMMIPIATIFFSIYRSKYSSKFAFLRSVAKNYKNNAHPKKRKVAGIILKTARLITNFFRHACATYVSRIALVCFAVVFVFVYYESVGKSQGNDIYEAISTNIAKQKDNSFIKTLSVAKIDGQDKSLFVINCGHTYCAGLEPNWNYTKGKLLYTVHYIPVGNYRTPFFKP